jgi:hypothetical protein
VFFTTSRHTFDPTSEFLTVKGMQANVGDVACEVVQDNLIRDICLLRPKSAITFPDSAKRPALCLLPRRQHELVTFNGAKSGAQQTRIKAIPPACPGERGRLPYPAAQTPWQEI